MQEGFTNGHRFWLSSEGNAIWAKNDGTKWYIAPNNYLGSTTTSLYVPIMDPNKECPHDNLQSNWWYFDVTDRIFQVDALDSVKVNCIKGKLVDHFY